LRVDGVRLWGHAKDPAVKRCPEKHALDFDSRDHAQSRIWNAMVFVQSHRALGDFSCQNAEARQERRRAQDHDAQRLFL